MLRVGDHAPEINRPGTDGKPFRLSDHSGRYTIVYFFPAAFTPGCTKESKRFRDNSGELSALGADVVGISTDSMTDQCNFAESLQVTFPMVSDHDQSVSRSYGVNWPLIGRARRVTFVVGPTQRIEATFWHEIQVNRHLDDVVAFLKHARPSRRSEG
ncbi:MAG: peroxiredoxin [Polyangiales bacterium]